MQRERTVPLHRHEPAHYGISPFRLRDLKAHGNQQQLKVGFSAVRTSYDHADVMGANIRAGVASVTRQDVTERIERGLPTVTPRPFKDLTSLGETVAHAARAW